MATTKLKPIYLYAEITRVDDEQRVAEGFAFVNPRVAGDSVNIPRVAMEAATPDYMKWGAIRSMHQPLAAGTALSVEWQEKGAFIRAKIVDDAEWKKVKERVYKGFSIGVRPDLIRGDTVEKLTWVETSLVDRPKDPDALFTAFRADGFDPGEEFECELLPAEDQGITRYQAGDEVRLLRDASNGAMSAGCLGTVTVDEGNTGVQVRWEVQPGVFNLQAYPRQEIERLADGIQSAPAGEPGAEPIQAGDCTITREGDLFVLNGPDGALIGKFATEAEARARAAEVADAMKDGDGGKDDATDQHGTTLVLPTDRAEEPTIAEGEELDLVRAEDGATWNLIRQSNGEVVHQAESIEAAGAWIKEALARAVTATTPSLPVRENLEGKTPKEERANDGDADDEKHVCRACGAEYGRCMGTRAEEPEVARTEAPVAEPEVSTPNDSVIPNSSDTPDPQIIARLETDNAALILRAETAETELARVQTAQEATSRDLASAKEQIQRLSDMPAPQQPLRFAHAVTREFLANAKLDHDGESTRIAARMTEISAMPPTQDLGEQTARAQEYQLLKMALAGRG